MPDTRGNRKEGTRRSLTDADPQTVRGGEVDINPCLDRVGRGPVLHDGEFIGIRHRQIGVEPQHEPKEKFGRAGGHIPIAGLLYEGVGSAKPEIAP